VVSVGCCGGEVSRRRPFSPPPCPAGRSLIFKPTPRGAWPTSQLRPDHLHPRPRRQRPPDQGPELLKASMCGRFGNAVQVRQSQSAIRRAPDAVTARASSSTPPARSRDGRLTGSNLLIPVARVRALHPATLLRSRAPGLGERGRAGAVASTVRPTRPCANRPR
jgi:hypothetical protein